MSLRDAAFHRVEGILVAKARDGAFKLQPSSLVELETLWRRRRRWAVTLELELERLARGLEATPPPAPPIILKGPAVKRFYADPSVRTFVDLDLLVPETSRMWWHEFLRRNGYAAPSAWRQRWDGFFHATVYRRRVGEREIELDLHRRLMITRVARDIDYAVLARFSEASNLPGIMWLRRDALLVTLALHLLHHAIETRRLIWLRDFVELASSEAILASARRIGTDLGVPWALDLALAHIPEHFGRIQVVPPSGLVAVMQRERRGLAYHRALFRELGLRRWAALVATTLDPERFRNPVTGRFDRGALTEWVRLQGRQVADSFRPRGRR